MLTYPQLKAALALALDTSSRNGGHPMAIIKRDEPRGWWDKWNTQPYAVVLHTHDLADDQIIVGRIMPEG